MRHFENRERTFRGKFCQKLLLQLAVLYLKNVVLRFCSRGIDTSALIPLLFYALINWKAMVAFHAEIASWKFSNRSTSSRIWRLGTQTWWSASQSWNKSSAVTHVSNWFCIRMDIGNQLWAGVRSVQDFLKPSYEPKMFSSYKRFAFSRAAINRFSNFRYIRRALAAKIAVRYDELRNRSRKLH